MITLISPALIFLCFEIGLRLSGYNAEKRDLFVEYEVNDKYLVVNPEYVTRYFPSFKPQIASNPFKKEKTDSTFRVFVFGGSSTQGFPYNFYYSFSSQLEQKLLLNTQGLHVEVINLGITAVNSYVIYDLAKKIQHYQPDAILIYAGHNEYYGSFGVGSSQFNFGNSITLKRLILWMKNSVVFQFIEELFAPDDKDRRVQRTLMARVVSESNIKKGDYIYNQGLTQFERNLELIESLLRKKKIPIFIGTVASNLKDQSPLSSLWEAHNAYDLGHRYLSLGDIDNAIIQLTKAKELDAIRFRAPVAINEIIIQFAKKKSVYLVDIESTINELSESKIADHSLFIDHLHPTKIGHEIIAELFFREINKVGLLDPYLRIGVMDVPDPESLFEQAYAITPIIRLTNGYPFIKGLNPDEELELFIQEYNYLQSKSFADSVGATTWVNGNIVALGLQKVINEAKLQKDSLLVAQASYELFSWLPFNKDLIHSIVDYQLGNKNLDIYTVNSILKALNNGMIDTKLIHALIKIYSSNNENEKAEYWHKKLIE